MKAEYDVRFDDDKIIVDEEDEEEDPNVELCTECGREIDVHWEGSDESLFGFGKFGDMYCKRCVEQLHYAICDQCEAVYDPDDGGTPIPEDNPGCVDKYLCPQCLAKQHTSNHS